MYKLCVNQQKKFANQRSYSRNFRNPESITIYEKCFLSISNSIWDCLANSSHLFVPQSHFFVFVGMKHKLVEHSWMYSYYLIHLIFKRPWGFHFGQKVSVYLVRYLFISADETLFTFTHFFHRAQSFHIHLFIFIISLALIKALCVN